MKITVLLLVLGLSFTSSAALVKLGEVTGVTDDINQRINDKISKATEKAAEKLEKDNLSTQILDRPLVNKTLPNKVDALLNNELANTVLAPVNQLTDRITILNKQKQPIFTDVAVENGARALEREWLITVEEQELIELENLANQGQLVIINQQKLALLAMHLVRIKVVKALDSYLDLEKVLSTKLATKLARNHVYIAQQQTTTEPAKLGLSHYAVCQNPVKIGMLDTAINLKHPAFAERNITQKNFIEVAETPKAHGSAVAALLISASPEVPALLPKAQLYAASVFYAQNDFSQGASLFHLLSGLEWLLNQQVSVINMSLAGPENAVLAQAIKQVQQQQVTIVAAAGNEGPSSPALYPAAYPDVIAVTAVDNNKNIYRWANQGEHIDFSAYGVNVLTARANGDFSLETGTSMATPVITAHVACSKSNYQQDFLLFLKAKAQDLGIKGRDRVFGNGFIE